MPETNTQSKKTFFKDYQNLMKDVAALTKDQFNPFFKSKYVPLKDVLREAKRVCLENNFIFHQTTYVDGEIATARKDETVVTQPATLLKTTLLHSSKESIESSIVIVAKDSTDPQKVGAGLTYMRRYSLTCILGIEETDDDGKKATAPANKAIEVETIVNSIKKVQEEMTLMEMKEKVQKSKLYKPAQKAIILKAIDEQLKLCK